MWESLLLFLRHIYRHTHIYIHGFALKWSITQKIAIEGGELDEKLLNLGVHLWTNETDHGYPLFWKAFSLFPGYTGSTFQRSSRKHK